MPPRKQGESLEHICFMTLASVIHRICVQLEEDPSQCQFSKCNLSSMVSRLPSLINEKIIVKVIDTIHQSIKRTRRTIGLLTCLEVLLQSHVQKLDLSGLFMKMRISGNINSGIRDVVSLRVATMSNLKSLNMISKCSDEILITISHHCKDIKEIVVTLSELVTDVGIEAVAKKCVHLEKLGIYKCWEVTSKGIELALLHVQNLKELQSDQLGAVLLAKFQKSDKMFKLIQFEQTFALFEPTQDEIQWIGRACKNLESARLFVEDSSLGMIHNLGKLKTLEVETSSILGEGFLTAMNNIGQSLVTLQLNCDSLSQEQLTTIGETCVSLSTLHIITATIEEDHRLKNEGRCFQSLNTLYLQVWKEAMLNAECVEFFLLWCKELVSIVIKAEMKFLTDQYLKNMLQINPLQSTTKIILTADKYVPLTIASVHQLMNSCPNLESLGISSWDISEEEFFQIRTYIKNENYNFAVS